MKFLSLFRSDKASVPDFPSDEHELNHTCAETTADSVQKHASLHVFHAHFEAKHAAETDMTTGPITENLLLFTLPILISQLLQQFYNIADTALVGRLIGANALAAAGTGGLLTSVIVNFYIGLSAGISIIISHLFGHHSYDKLKDCIRTIIVTSILFGILFTIAGIAGTGQFLRWLSTPEDVMPLAASYLRVVFLGLAAQLLYNVGTAILRALGNTTSALYYLIFSSACNLILDVVFLAVIPMGIAGAALATMISQYISAFLILRKLCMLDDFCRLTFTAPFIRMDFLKNSLGKGIPSGMQAVFMSISSLVIQTYINSFGYSAMAGMTVFSKVEGFLYFPLFSYGIALTSFIGQNIGAGDYNRVKKGMSISMKLTVIGSILMGIITLTFARPALGLFTTDSSVIHNGLEACIFVFPMYWLYAINQVYIGVIRGMGHTFYPMLTSLCSYCFFRIAWCTAWDFYIHDMKVVYTSYDVSWVIMAALLAGGYLYYRNRDFTAEDSARNSANDSANDNPQHKAA